MAHPKNLSGTIELVLFSGRLEVWDWKKLNEVERGEMKWEK